MTYSEINAELDDIIWQEQLNEIEQVRQAWQDFVVRFKANHGVDLSKRVKIKEF